MLRGNCSFGFTSRNRSSAWSGPVLPYPKPSALRVRLRVGFISSPVGSVVVHFVGPLTRSSSPCRANTGMIDHRGEGGSAGTAPWASSQRTRSTAWFGSWVSGYAPGSVHKGELSTSNDLGDWKQEGSEVVGFGLWQAPSQPVGRWHGRSHRRIALPITGRRGPGPPSFAKGASGSR
jgi:hypothetical protein